MHYPNLRRIYRIADDGSALEKNCNRKPKLMKNQYTYESVSLGSENVWCLPRLNSGNKFCQVIFFNEENCQVACELISVYFVWGFQPLRHMIKDLKCDL